MPNLGLYSVPDGPVVNPADLLPLGKIDEAQQAYEEMAEYAIKDMVYVGSELYEKAGADGIYFDTTAAAGDAEFYAALKAAEILHDKYPAMGIEMGMSGEFILGMHAAHAVVSGMGGMRTAGDLVARLQLNRGMKIDAAKKYVADKLGVSATDLADTVVMNEIREDLDIGRVNETPAVAKGIDAKLRIAELLDLEINCVNMFKDRVGIRSYQSFN